MSKQKILIVVPRYNNTNEIEYAYPFPLGLGYISATLKNAGYQVDCLNLNHHKGLIEDITTNALQKQDYDYICTGTVSSGFIFIEKIITAVRLHKSNPKIILGGLIITGEPNFIFNALKPDFAVIGEGEETIIELLEYLEKKGNLAEVKGIGYRDENNNIIFTQQREQIKNIDTIPIPDYEGFGYEEKLDNEHPNEFYHNTLLDYSHTYPIIASRGCPYKCTFCYHYNRYVGRSIDAVMKELNIMVKRYKINSIMIYDECFTLEKSRMYEFCKRMKELREDISWHLQWECQLTVKTLDIEILKTMKDAGCVSVAYGFESYSPKVLKSMNKPITPYEINRALHETLDAKMSVLANFIFGDVAETKETAKETLDYWKDNCKGQINLDFVKPYPNSELYKHCFEKGLLKDKLDFTKNLTGIGFNMTDNMTEQEYNQLHDDIDNALDSHRRYVRPIAMYKESKDTYSLKVKCPNCNEVIVYKDFSIKKTLLFVVHVLCRNCFLSFDVVSNLQYTTRACKSIYKIKRTFWANILYYIDYLKIKKQKYFVKV